MELTKIYYGNGTLEDPDQYICPLCGGVMVSGYMECSDGSLHGDGSYWCLDCSEEIDSVDEIIEECE